MNNIDTILQYLMHGKGSASCENYKTVSSAYRSLVNASQVTLEAHKKYVVLGSLESSISDSANQLIGSIALISGTASVDIHHTARGPMLSGGGIALWQYIETETECIVAVRSFGTVNSSYKLISNLIAICVGGGYYLNVVSAMAYAVERRWQYEQFRYNITISDEKRNTNKADIDTIIFKAVGWCCRVLWGSNKSGLYAFIFYCNYIRYIKQQRLAADSCLFNTRDLLHKLLLAEYNVSGNHLENNILWNKVALPEGGAAV